MSHSLYCKLAQPEQQGVPNSAQVDVVVVGAGPAGAWAAYGLARQGANVLVLDHSHPREKPCGGGLTRRALRLVAPALPRRLDGVAVEGGVFDEPTAVDLIAGTQSYRGLRLRLVRTFEWKLAWQLLRMDRGLTQA